MGSEHRTAVYLLVFLLFMFPCSLSDQELFTGQFGGLDSGFNSVDSGSKRWSGNEVELVTHSHVTTVHVAPT